VHDVAGKASGKGEYPRYPGEDAGLSDAGIKATPLVFVVGPRGNDVEQVRFVFFGGRGGEVVDVQ
jgi:hypothetical protein